LAPVHAGAQIDLVRAMHALGLLVDGQSGGAQRVVRLAQLLAAMTRAALRNSHDNRGGIPIGSRTRGGWPADARGAKTGRGGGVLSPASVPALVSCASRSRMPAMTQEDPGDRHSRQIRFAPIGAGGQARIRTATVAV